MSRGNFKGEERPVIKYMDSRSMPFGLWAQIGPWNHVGLLSEGAHWRHLLSTIEPSMCGGDAAFCQISLTTCYSTYRRTVNLESEVRAVACRCRTEADCVSEWPTDQGSEV